MPLDACHDHGLERAGATLDMTRLMIGLVLLATTAAAAPPRQMPKYGVTVTPEKNVNYTQLRTYAWRRAQPSQDKAVDSQIVAAIDRELAALGMTKGTERVDTLVGYGSLTRTDVNLKGKEDAKGLLPQYWVGTLVVVFTDPATERRLLRMRVDLPIDIKPDELHRAIDKAVALMFAKYPTRER
jgi:hypothetical protein